MSGSVAKKIRPVTENIRIRTGPKSYVLEHKISSVIGMLTADFSNFIVF